MLFSTVEKKNIDETVEMMEFQELSGDQRREAVNTQQRYAAYREAEDRANGYRGSMVWKKIQAREYLVRSHYAKSGVRRQTSLGLRSKKTEAIKLEYGRGRTEARDRLKELQASSPGKRRSIAPSGSVACR